VPVRRYIVGGAAARRQDDCCSSCVFEGMIRWSRTRRRHYQQQQECQAANSMIGDEKSSCVIGQLGPQLRFHLRKWHVDSFLFWRCRQFLFWVSVPSRPLVQRPLPCSYCKCCSGRIVRSRGLDGLTWGPR
jgi:hypothetical protein